MTELYSGILNINKPAGWTSHDVVARVRRILGQRAVGHAGTLDPLATGVLLVCAGQATRLSEYLMAGDKVYRADIRLGVATDTYDAGGQVTATAAVPHLSADDLAVALESFTGAIQQAPPAYSAVKQGGVAAHRRARRGEAVTLAPRPVVIHHITLLGWQSPDLTVEVTCGPGTYIRSLAHDLGARLGCGAYLTGLVRLRSGHFTLEDALTLETLAEAAAAGNTARCLHPLSSALSNLTALPLDAENADHLRHGRPIPAGHDESGANIGYGHTADGQVVAIVERRDGQWWPQKVFSQAD